MNTFRKLSLLSVFCAVALVGCGGDDGQSKIDFVKAQSSAQDGYTVGQVLDNKKSCKSVQWSVSKDDHQRDVVRFECPIETTGTVLEQRVNHRIEEVSTAYEHAIVTPLQNLPFWQKNLNELRERAAHRPANWREGDADGTDLSRIVAVDEQALHDYTAAGEECAAELKTRRDDDLTRIKTAALAFHTLTEVGEFVVNQGQIVEMRTALMMEDAPLALNEDERSTIGRYLTSVDAQAYEFDGLARIMIERLPLTQEVWCSHPLQQAMDAAFKRNINVSDTEGSAWQRKLSVSSAEKPTSSGG